MREAFTRAREFCTRKPTAVVVALLLLAPALTWPARGVTEVANCPLAGKRPPDGFLTQESHLSLCKADLTGANLRGANLPGANLGEADLREANLRGANLPNADLSRANLRGADLRGANLSGANLGEADLRDAKLHGANLPNADLRSANLANANLAATNLRTAKGLTCDQIRAAQTDGSTHLPVTLKCAQ
jgi:uncharacterized protein YjbI with pentapeptide repeats